jgi:uncharacterized protein YyaL (SSP411 family)
MATESKVAWRDWSDEAFADAKTQDKPVLLGISAVWCHWCHVMDRGVAGDPVHTGVYNNPQLADYINAHYIPIRVDNDQRPDINARYNMGGWPTTCFLTPDGDVIYGGTYLAPAQMRQLLPRIVDVWRDNKDELLAQVQEGRKEEAVVAGDGQQTTDEASVIVQLSSSANDIINGVANNLVRNFDPKHGGLGNSQKFPMSDAWSLLLAVSSISGEQRLLDMTAQTLVAMGTKGMYDLVAGGWFRYSTTPDWSVPHFEKMLEDHARLLPPYLSAIQLLPDGEQKVTLQKVVRSSIEYLMNDMLHDETGLVYFAGSQDADEEYYMLSKDERAALEAPFIDWRLYTDWNALMVSALLQASIVLDEPKYAGIAKRIWHTLVTRCVNDDGSVRHSLDFGHGPKASSLTGLLGDQASLALASMHIAQHDPTLNADAITLARGMLACALRELSADDGGFHDSPANPDAKGMLKTRIKPIFDNCAIADALLLMSHLEDEAAEEARETARETLAAFLEEYKRYREHGSPYALAVMRAVQAPDEIMIVAKPEESVTFIDVAHETYSPWRVVRVLDPVRDAEAIAKRGYPTKDLPAAFVCKGTTCSAPAFNAAALREAIG